MQETTQTTKDMPATRPARKHIATTRRLHLLIRVSFVLTMLFLGMAFADAPLAHASLDSPSKCGALCVKNGHLASKKTGKKVQLRGVSTHGLAWYPQYVNKAACKTLHREWGANVVRLALYTQEYGGYCSGGSKHKLISLVNRGISYATSNDMYVIVDWHILSDGNPNTHLKAAKAFFRRIAKAHAKAKNVIYEICNEPNGNTSWKAIKRYARKLITLIHARDKDACIIVGTPTWSQDLECAIESPLSARYAKNVLYALHFYAGTHKADLRARTKVALEAGLPVFVSEFGTCQASGTGAVNIAQANKWLKLLDAYKVSFVNWSLSNKAESASIIKARCTKTSAWKTSQLTKSGTWLRKALRKRR